jgi:hypothetical protein
MSGAMDQSYFREQADRCRRLARDSTDTVLKVSLRKLADEYQMRADELENDEISAELADSAD